jgi:hypothetical protein
MSYDNYDEESNDYYDEEYDDDYDEDNDYENIYDCDELSTTKYNIILCELYNETIHGPSDNNAVNSGYLVLYRFKKFNMNNIIPYSLSYLSKMHYILNDALIDNNANALQHHTIRNYEKLYLKIQPEIAECHYLSGGELMAVKKTIWIKLIQRTWKNIYKKRQEIIKIWCSPYAIMHRELYGKWPNNARILPSINGMLYYLSKK